jgi:putative hemolysin
VIVANHPFGVLDGLALCQMVTRVRSNFRLLINSVLCRDDRFDEHFLPVNFRDTRDAQRTNLRTLRTALSTLAEDGAVVMFPAGGIATAPSWFGPAEDLDWKPSVAKLVAASEATVVPVYFPGQNSRLFHWASRLSLTLRLALIIREVMKRRGDTLPMRVGSPIPYEQLADHPDRASLTEALRTATFALADTRHA